MYLNSCRLQVDLWAYMGSGAGVPAERAWERVGGKGAVRVGEGGWAGMGTGETPAKSSKCFGKRPFFCRPFLPIQINQQQ